MKTFILTALIAAAGVATITTVTLADTFTIHGYQGTHYGR